ncbi:helix-turn-helix transcriptional regulator [Noviherbaspirillum sp.]|uniref:helix-turn-helix transcriptional regulator n=1 Tax=Noviherbaspirillum sp. TaxID=1926288 RepID=UPI002FDFE317
MTNSRRGPAARPFGTGRIIFWRGGSLWIGHAGEETGFHEHHAIQITLTLSGDAVRFRSPGQGWVFHAAAIVAAHQSHAFEARGELVALVFAEPESLEGRALRERYPEGVSALDAGDLAEQAVRLAALYAQDATDDELADCARAVTTRLSSIHLSSAKPLDKRIMRAIDILRDRIADTVTMTEIAEAVHLSPGRFRHLFLQETGIRFRPYVLWLRLEVAVALYGAGSSLTDASHAGGFADSAHFSRTFKRMFGVTAIGVQRV